MDRRVAFGILIALAGCMNREDPTPRPARARPRPPVPPVVVEKAEPVPAPPPVVIEKSEPAPAPPPAPKPPDAAPPPAPPAPPKVEPAGRVPEGERGLAAKYPGDAGIEDDPDVIFVEMFEDSIDRIFSRWENVQGKSILSKAGDVPPGSAGKSSLLASRVPGNKEYGGGGALYTRLKKKSGGYGYDRVFARFYMKFNEDHSAIHHYGTHLGGYNPPSRWPMMKAGEPPPGDLSFNCGIEPYGKRWEWSSYTYWQHMRGSPPAGKTWGNSFQYRVPKEPVARGRWICVEMMIKVNDIGKANGELAFWVDGKLNRHEGVVTSHVGPGFPRGTWSFDKFSPGYKGRGITWSREKGGRTEIDGDEPFPGFEWRSVPELNVNYVWLYRYMSQPETGRSDVWWDHVVVATKYIGPIAPKN